MEDQTVFRRSGVVAKKLGVSVMTINRMYERGQLRGYRLPSGALRIDMSSVEELLQPTGADR